MKSRALTTTVFFLISTILFGAATASAQPDYKLWSERVAERSAERLHVRHDAARLERTAVGMYARMNVYTRMGHFARGLDLLQNRLDLQPTHSPWQRQLKAKVVGRLLFLRKDFHDLERHRGLSRAEKRVQMHLLEARLQKVNCEVLDAITRL